MSDTKLAIVVVTWGQWKHKLPLFLHSCMLQEDQRFRVDVYHDGNKLDPDFETRRSASETEGLVEDFKDRFLDDIFPVSLVCTEQRYNDWGHSLREIGIKNCSTEYLNIQNGDNYLTPLFTRLLLEKAITENLDFCYCNILHNYPNVNFDGAGPYNVLNSSPRQDHIDISNFIVRTELAQKVGFTDRSFGADGIFVEKLVKTFPAMRIGKVRSCLSVHN